ncbi:MAG: hypothetical protein K0S88_5610, partial [Actinomycetia bacterium]|nr:hypothetical protein [Actinomycetes bacterium]
RGQDGQEQDEYGQPASAHGLAPLVRG